MSFYNADPRAYFEWYDKKWSEVWNNGWQLDNLEVGRLVRIINTSSEDQSHNYKIYKVEYGTKDPTVSSDNEQSPHKYLKEFTFTNPFSLVVGTGVNANTSNINQTVVGKYNEDDGDDGNALFIVGTGTDANNKKNGLVVTSSGDVKSETFQSGNNKLTADGLYLNNASPITLGVSGGNPVLMLGNNPIATGNISIDGVAKYTPEAKTVAGQKIGDIEITSETGGSTPQPVNLPTTIIQSTTFDNNTTTTFNGTIQIGTAQTGSSQTNENDPDPAKNPNNLHYGKYTIAFVETMPASPNNNTLYFVLGTGTN